MPFVKWSEVKATWWSQSLSSLSKFVKWSEVWIKKPPGEVKVCQVCQSLLSGQKCELKSHLVKSKLWQQSPAPAASLSILMPERSNWKHRTNMNLQKMYSWFKKRQTCAPQKWQAGSKYMYDMLCYVMYNMYTWVSNQSTHLRPQKWQARSKCRQQGQPWCPQWTPSLFAQQRFLQWTSLKKQFLVDITDGTR